MTDELRVHLHFTMRGTFPLRLLDILFGTERLHYVEYGYLTPVDLAIGSATRRARAFAQQVTEDPHRVTEAHVESLRDVGFDESDIIQLLAVIGTCNTSNMIVSSLNITPDDRRDELPT